MRHNVDFKGLKEKKTLYYYKCQLMWALSGSDANWSEVRLGSGYSYGW